MLPNINDICNHEKKKQVEQKKYKWSLLYSRALKLINISAVNDLYNRRQEAVELLLQVLEYDTISSDKRAIVHDNIAFLLFERHEYKKAIVHYRKSIECHPRFWKGYYNLGVSLMKTNCLLEARKHLDTAHEINPECPKYHEHVSEIKQRLERDATEAMNISSKVHSFRVEMTEARHITSMSIKEYKSNAKPPVIQLAPQDKIMKQSWTGGIAAVLHRVYVKAAAMNTTFRSLCEAKDPLRTGYISMASLCSLLEMIEVEFLDSEKRDLTSLFPNERIWYSILVPNEETVAVSKRVNQIGSRRSSYMIRPKINASLSVRRQYEHQLHETTLTDWIQQCAPKAASKDVDRNFKSLVAIGILRVYDVIHAPEFTSTSLREMGILKKAWHTKLIHGQKQLVANHQIHCAILIQSRLRILLAMQQLSKLKKQKQLDAENRIHHAATRIQNTYRFYLRNRAIFKLQSNMLSLNVQHTMQQLLISAEAPEKTHVEALHLTDVVPTRTELRHHHVKEQPLS